MVQKLVFAADVVVQRPRLNTDLLRDLSQASGFESVLSDHRHGGAANELFSRFPTKPCAAHNASSFLKRLDSHRLSGELLP